MQRGELGLSNGCHVGQQLDRNRSPLVVRHTTLLQNHRARIDRLLISNFHHAGINRFTAIGHNINRLKTLKILVAPVDRQRDIDISHLSKLLADLTHLLGRFAVQLGRQRCEIIRRLSLFLLQIKLWHQGVDQCMHQDDQRCKQTD